MNIDKIPIIGKVNRSVDMIVLNFVILGVIFLILGFAIIFFPRVLDIMVSVFLILSALLLLNIAFHIHHTKKKYTNFLKD